MHYISPSSIDPSAHVNIRAKPVIGDNILSRLTHPGLLAIGGFNPEDWHELRSVEHNPDDWPYYMQDFVHVSSRMVDVSSPIDHRGIDPHVFRHPVSQSGTPAKDKFANDCAAACVATVVNEFSPTFLLDGDDEYEEVLAAIGMKKDKPMPLFSILQGFEKLGTGLEATIRRASIANLFDPDTVNILLVDAEPLIGYRFPHFVVQHSCFVMRVTQGVFKLFTTVYDPYTDRRMVIDMETLNKAMLGGGYNMPFQFISVRLPQEDFEILEAEEGDND
jgi:hypothetical protein